MFSRVLLLPMARPPPMVSGDEHAEGRCGQWGVWPGFLVKDEGFEMMKHDCVMMEMLAQYCRCLLTPKFQCMSNLCTRVLSMHSTHSPTSKQQCMIQIFSAHKCRFRSIYLYIYTIIHISMYVIFFRKVFCWIATGDFSNSFLKIPPLEESPRKMPYSIAGPQIKFKWVFRSHSPRSWSLG